MRKTWTEIVKKDCQARALYREDAVDRNKWTKQIKLDDDLDRCDCVNVAFGISSLR